MDKTVETIVSEVLDLSPQARAFLAEKLIESLDIIPGSEISAAWRKEIRKRCKEVDDGAVELHDAAAVFAKAYTTIE